MQRYKGLGLKLTPQRLAILDFLEGNITHPSADEIYRAVSKIFPTMSFATVYNTLDKLTEKGMVFELKIDPDKKRFDPDTRPHHHLICSRCGKVADVHGEFTLDLPEELKSGFRLTGTHIEFHGICAYCAKQGR